MTVSASNSTSNSIHPTAIIAPGAEIGRDVQIGAYSIVGSEVRIGDGSIIGPHVVLEGRVTLGQRNFISQFASIGSRPQDLKFKGEPSEVIIGDDNQIREYVTIQPGTEHGTMKTIIGNKNLFMVGSHVAHDCRVGNANVVANGVAFAGHVQIGSGVILGGMVGLHQFIRVGDLAFIGAGSMVAKDVPPFAMAQGDRCSMRGINLVGLKRSGVGLEDVRAIKRAYRHLFFQTGSMPERVAALDPALAANISVQRVTSFLESSRRGFISFRTRDPNAIADEAVE